MSVTSRNDDYLHGFVVNERVNGYRRCLVIRGIRLATEACSAKASVPDLPQYLENAPPRCCPDGKPSIRRHSRNGDRSVVPSEFVRLTVLLGEHAIDMTVLTRMPQTNEISSAVGTMRNMIACRMNVMPLHNISYECRTRNRTGRTSFPGRSHESSHPSGETDGT